MEEKYYDLLTSGLTPSQKYEVLDFFYVNYYDTAQDSWEFAEEFYSIFGIIHSDGEEFPRSLLFLVDYEEGLAELLDKFM